jgi:hypothetical protein
MPPPRVRATQPQQSFSPFVPDSSLKQEDEPGRRDNLQGRFPSISEVPPAGRQTDNSAGKPDAGKAREPLMGGFGDFFNESTGQLLPDTLDVKPRAIPQVQGGIERNQVQGGIERNSNGSAGASAHMRPEFPDQATDISSGEFASTDELEMDKTLDKTVETPVLVLSHDRTEDKSGEASAAGFSLNSHEQADRFSRPLFNSISSGSGQSLPLERNQRIERIALVLAIITTLAGLAILLWLLVLRPRASTGYYEHQRLITVVYLERGEKEGRMENGGSYKLRGATARALDLEGRR